MFKTIVLAMDGSDGSQRAVPYAVELARQSGARIVIAHVIERLIAKGGMPTVDPNEEQVSADLKRRAEEISEQGVKASFETATLVLGGPAHAIEEIAARVDADLIVVGTRGHSSVAGLLLGSVTQRLLHISTSPVLAVPPAA